MISAHHLAAWRSLGPRARVVAICDPDAARAAKRAEEFGIPATYRDREAMLDDVAIDALDVATPRETHADWVEAAAARGVDVLCQKPLTPTLAEAETLIRRIDGRIRLMVHENWRVPPLDPQLKTPIPAGPARAGRQHRQRRLQRLAADPTRRQAAARDRPRRCRRLSGELRWRHRPFRRLPGQRRAVRDRPDG